MSTLVHDSQIQPRVQEEDQSVCHLERGSGHAIASQSGRTSSPAQGLEQKTGNKQCEQSVASPAGLCLLPVLLPGTGNVGRAQRDWFALRAGLAQTAGAVTRLDWVVAFRTLRSASKASLAPRRSGTSAYRGCNAMENARRNG